MKPKCTSNKRGTILCQFLNREVLKNSSAASILERIECWWWRGFELINQIKIWWRKRKFDWKSRRREGGKKTGPLEVWWTGAVYMQLIHISRAALISPSSPSSINQADVNPHLPAPLCSSMAPYIFTKRSGSEKRRARKRRNWCEREREAEWKEIKACSVFFPHYQEQCSLFFITCSLYDFFVSLSRQIHSTPTPLLPPSVFFFSATPTGVSLNSEARCGECEAQSEHISHTTAQQITFF